MPTSSNLTRSELLIDLIHALEHEGQNLCILHGYKDYPEKIDSDIDAISNNPEQIPHILSKQGVATVVQLLQHETTAFFYVLLRNDQGKPAFISLDVSADYRRNGRIFFTGKEFFQDCRSFKFFKVPKPQLEFIYYVVKKIAKGSLNKTQAGRLSELYKLEPVECEQQLTRFYPKSATRLIVESAQSGNWEPVSSQTELLRQEMLNKVKREQPQKVFWYWLQDMVRRGKRFLQPTGLMVVFLGSDGSGKSTVIDRVKQDLEPAFRKTQYIHLRPRLGLAVNESDVPVLDPHGQPARSWLVSTAKIFYFLFDYCIGYLWRLYPQMVRSTFIVFDRYYHDLLVDPKRYRFGGSLWLAQLLGKLIPQPDLWILLDAPPEVLQSRKQEVSFKETVRQREAYLKMVSRFSNSVTVDASQPLDKVVANVNQEILELMAQRMQKRLRF